MAKKKDDSLYKAVYADDIVGVKEALSRGSIPGTNEFVTSIHRKQPEILRLLVSVPGINLDKEGYRNVQPLSKAIGQCDLEATKILLAAGASPHVQTGYGSVLRKAASMGFTAAIPLLLKAGADVNAKQEQGHTALMAAATGNHLEIAKMLLLAGARPTDIDIIGRNAYDLAVAEGNQAIAKLLEPFEAQRKVR